MGVGEIFFFRFCLKETFWIVYVLVFGGRDGVVSVDYRVVEVFGWFVFYLCYVF